MYQSPSPSTDTMPCHMNFCVHYVMNFSLFPFDGHVWETSLHFLLFCKRWGIDWFFCGKVEKIFSPPILSFVFFFLSDPECTQQPEVQTNKWINKIQKNHYTQRHTCAHPQSASAPNHSCRQDHSSHTPRCKHTHTRTHVLVLRYFFLSPSVLHKHHMSEGLTAHLSVGPTSYITAWATTVTPARWCLLAERGPCFVVPQAPSAFCSAAARKCQLTASRVLARVPFVRLCVCECVRGVNWLFLSAGVDEHERSLLREEDEQVAFWLIRWD